MNKLFVSFALILPLFVQSLEAQDDDVSILAEMMIGDFSSEKQSANDTNYFHIDLHMGRIWEDDSEIIWLYVEQALGSKPEKPYRQRVYRVSYEGDGVFASAVYELQNPERFINSWESDYNQFAEFGPDSLISREGCTVYLKWEGDHYAGSTPGKECLSTLYGASYATSIVEIWPEGITSWDRGFDENDEHIWGAEHGPYMFDRKD